VLISILGSPTDGLVSGIACVNVFAFLQIMSVFFPATQWPGVAVTRSGPQRPELRHCSTQQQWLFLSETVSCSLQFETQPYELICDVVDACSCAVLALFLGRRSPQSAST